MEESKNQNILKSIRLDPWLCEKIQEMADESQRDFTKQVRFMLKEYIKIKERL